MKLLQVDFNFTGPFGEEMAEKLAGLAESINNEPGFIWTESRKDQLAGGIYLFEDEASADAYLKSLTRRFTRLISLS